MKKLKTADRLVDQAKKWIGCRDNDGSHHKIIDIYNEHRPLARGYKMKYTDAWCSTFVSACAIATGMTDIIPTEVGCEPHINLFKEKGIWVEKDSYVPKKGDIIFYDWDDNGYGDNKNWSDHVGIVEKVVGGMITVIEGNMGFPIGVVGRRTIPVNGKYIRGFGVPKYDKEPKPVKPPKKPQIVKHWVLGYTVLMNSANFRKTMSTKADNIICKIPHGTILKELERKGDWAKISYNGKIGYVKVTYTTIKK